MVKKSYPKIALLALVFSCFVSRGQSLWGVTGTGGTYNAGTLGHYDPATSVWTVDHSFSFGDVIDPSFGAGVNPSTLTNVNGKFYGTTMTGGINGAGELFEFDPETKVYTKKYDFSYKTGVLPVGTLVLWHGKLYGLTEGGGVSGLGQGGGVLFEWDPATDVYTAKAFGNGVAFGSLTEHNDKFYFMGSNGGTNLLGAILEWNPATNQITTKIEFNNSTGTYPHGSLTYGTDKFYGMTNSGGLYNDGVLFEWNPDTNVFIKKVDFGATGNNPRSSLTFYNGKLYGMTYGGGIGQGELFEWDPSLNKYTTKVKFDGTGLGANPAGFLTFSLGKFYGMTSQGGALNKGVLFEWDPQTNICTKKVDFNSINGANPGTTALTVRLETTQTITFNPLDDKPYRAASFVLKATASSGLPVTYKSSNTAVATISGNVVTVVNPGFTTITASQAGNELVQPAPDVSQTLTVYLPPNVFVLNPGDGTSNQKTSLNVKSKLVVGASTYTIQLSTMADFSNNVITKAGGYILHFDSLQTSTKYYARVKTELDPHFGRTTSFTTVAPVVYLVYPADHAVNSKVKGIFSTLLVNDATLYTLELSKTSTFTDSITVVTHNTNNLPRQGLQYATTYYARVKTNAFTGFGKTTSFTTMANPATLRRLDADASPAQEEIIGYNPNPFHTSFTLNVNGSADKPVRVTISDLAGVVLSDFVVNNNEPLRLGQNLSTGIYVLRVMTSRKTIAHRIVKD